MFSFKLVILFAVVLMTLAEPPRRRSRFRSFARQEEPENDQSESGPYPPAGWKPEGERLVLPIRAKQEQEFQGYNYPKPETTESPEETTTDSTEESTTDENTTDLPQSSNVRIAPEKLKQLLKKQKAELKSLQHLQPFFYYINPSQLTQPQLVYILQ